jgi:hypothetical protein
MCLAVAFGAGAKSVNAATVNEQFQWGAGCHGVNMYIYVTDYNPNYSVATRDDVCTNTNGTHSTGCFRYWVDWVYNNVKTRFNAPLGVCTTNVASVVSQPSGATQYMAAGNTYYEAVIS